MRKCVGSAFAKDCAMRPKQLLRLLRGSLQPLRRFAPPPHKWGGPSSTPPHEWGGAHICLDADWFADQEDRRPARHEVPLDDQRPRDLRPDAHLLAQARVLVGKDVLVDARESAVEVR